MPDIPPARREFVRQLAVCLACPEEALYERRLLVECGLDAVAVLNVLAFLARRGFHPSDVILDAELSVEKLFEHTLQSRIAFLDESLPADAHAFEQPMGYTARTALRQVLPRDLDYLAVLFSQAEVGFRGAPPGPAYAPAALQRLVWQDVPAACLIIRRLTGDPTGFVQLHSPDLKNRTMSLSFRVEPAHLARGWPLEAVLLLLRYTFEVWDARRVSLEVLTPDFVPLRSGEGRLFHYEGRLVEHAWHMGAPCDLHLLAIDRQLWQRIDTDLLQPLLQQLRGPELAARGASHR